MSVPAAGGRAREGVPFGPFAARTRRMTGHEHRAADGNDEAYLAV